MVGCTLGRRWVSRCSGLLLRRVGSRRDAIGSTDGRPGVATGCSSRRDWLDTKVPATMIVSLASSSTSTWGIVGRAISASVGLRRLCCCVVDCVDDSSGAFVGESVSAATACSVATMFIVLGKVVGKAGRSAIRGLRRLWCAGCGRSSGGSIGALGSVAGSG